MHEAQMHEQNSFITLTYNDENLRSPSLEHRDFQLFIKRLRKSLGSKNRAQHGGFAPIPPISYYMAGEYGTQTRRPHFHACIFGWEPKDKLYWRTTGSKSRLYTSEQLDKLWGKGFASIGDVNFESAAYIARYIMAKITGPNAWQYYMKVNEETGEITELKPEYNRMSLKTPIGKTWIQKYETDVYPEGEILIRKVKTKTPKYYDRQYKKKEPDQYEEMKMKREMQSKEYLPDNTEQRLKAKERVKLAQINKLTRNL